MGIKISLLRHRSFIVSWVMPIFWFLIYFLKLDYCVDQSITILLILLKEYFHETRDLRYSPKKMWKFTTMVRQDWYYCNNSLKTVLKVKVPLLRYATIMLIFGWNFSNVNSFFIQTINAKNIGAIEVAKLIIKSEKVTT